MRTLDELPPGRRLLVRLDLNSPVENGTVRDNRRFARHAETLAELVAADHRIAVLAHQGRPGRETFVRLTDHAALLADHLGHPVEHVPDTCGDEALAAIRGLGPGEVRLLENVRMTDDELPERPPAEHARSELVERLAPEFDAYVDDAFSAAHRSHASLVGFPRRLPAYAGRVMEREYEATTAIADREFDGEVTMALGGTKPADVARVIDAVADRVDEFLVGGVPGQLFLRARGADVGRGTDDDLLAEGWAATDDGDRLRDLLARHGDAIRLPTDLAYADADGDRAEVAVDAAPGDRRYRDVGTETVMEFAPTVRRSAAVFLKGALGVFEDERFSVGTVGLLEAAAGADTFSVIGGGDTSRAVDLYEMDEADFSHVTIAGGAYLQALTGEPLPAVEALEAAADGGR